jgi:hypothetical protein
MALFPTNAAQVQTFATALYGVQVGTTTMAQVTADIQAAGGLNNALNSYYTASFGAATTASVAQTIATNVGLGTDTNAIAFITAQLNAAAPAARGAAVIGMLNNFLNTTTGTYATAAAAFNTTVSTAVAYTGSTNVALGTANPPVINNFVLTAGIDTFTATSASDVFYGVIAPGSATTLASASSLNDLDTLVGFNGGNNTLKLAVDNTNAAASFNVIPVGAGISNIPNLIINAGGVQTATQAATIDLSKVGGATSISLTNTEATYLPVTVDNMSGSQVATLSGALASATTLKYNGLTPTSNTSLVMTGLYGTSTTSKADVTLSTGTNKGTSDVSPNLLSLSGSGGSILIRDTSLTTLNAKMSGTSTIELYGTGTALQKIDLTGSTGKVTVDLAGPGLSADSYAVSTQAFSTTASSILYQGGSANDTLVTYFKDGTTSSNGTGTLTNYSSSVYKIDGGAGVNVFQLYNEPATGGAAPGVTINSSGVTNATSTSLQTLNAINGLTNFQTLKVTDLDTTTSAATTTVAEGPISIDVSSVTSLTDFSISASFMYTAGTGGYAAITGTAATTATGAGGAGVSLLSTVNADTFTLAGRITGGASASTSSVAAGNAIYITPLVDTNNNSVTITLSTATITGGAAGTSATSTATSGNGLSFGNEEVINLVSTSTSVNTTGNYLNSLTAGAVTGTTHGTAGYGVSISTGGTLNISGSANIKLSTVGGTNYNVNAGALSGDLYLLATDTTNDTFTMGSGSNNIALSGGQWTVDATKATSTQSLIVADTTSSTSTAPNNLANTYTVAGTSISTAIDQIIGWNSNVVLNLKGTPVLGSSSTASYAGTSGTVNATYNALGNITLSTASGSPSLSDKINAAFNVLSTTQYAIGEVEINGSTYIVENTSSTNTGATPYAAGDVIIQLVGTTGVTGISTTGIASNTIYVS